MPLNLTALRRMIPSAIAVVALLWAALLIAGLPNAHAEVTYGTLSNFDVFNETPEEEHGFEIEIEGIHSSEITYTFGAPYERYGNPAVTDTAAGVQIRYESPYDPNTHSFTQGTPVAASPITPTLGHQCWTGGSANYFTSGCEHFGIGLRGNPTKTTYSWLSADPAHPGNLIASGSRVSMPAPQWSVQPGGVVQAVIDAPEREGVQEFGEAEWVKVYETEAPQKVELNHLLTDDPIVPEEPAQTETEWVLMQSASGGEGNARGKLAEEKPLGAGAESVTRRYEVYEYTGVYDPETHEAMPGVNDNTPAEGELGGYRGAQMAALNVEGGEPAPTVSKVSPKKGPAAGGTRVKITGSHFNGVSAVSFGGVAAVSFTVKGATITAVAPPGTSGVTDVRLTSPNGTSAAVAGDHFTYEAPVIASVSPGEGTKGGGTPVTIVGSGFAPGEGTVVLFGKTASLSVQCESSSTCTAVSPAASKATTVDVLAAVGKSKSKKSAADHFSYR